MYVTNTADLPYFITYDNSTGNTTRQFTIYPQTDDDVGKYKVSIRISDNNDYPAINYVSYTFYIYVVTDSSNIVVKGTTNPLA